MISDGDDNPTPIYATLIIIVIFLLFYFLFIWENQIPIMNSKNNTITYAQYALTSVFLPDLDERFNNYCENECAKQKNPLSQMGFGSKGWTKNNNDILVCRCTLTGGGPT